MKKRFLFILSLIIIVTIMPIVLAVTEKEGDNTGTSLSESFKKKEEEYKQLLLEDSDPSTIDALLELCEDYIKEKNDPTINGSTDFIFVMMYDMWINNSHVWPVKHNLEWEKWDKLKDKKVKRRDK